MVKNPPAKAGDMVPHASGNSTATEKIQNSVTRDATARISPLTATKSNLHSQSLEKTGM